MKFISYFSLLLLNAHKKIDVNLYSDFLPLSAQNKTQKECLKHYVFLGEDTGCSLHDEFDPIAFILRHPLISKIPLSKYLLWRLFFKLKIYSSTDYVSYIKFEEAKMKLAVLSESKPSLGLTFIKAEINKRVKEQKSYILDREVRYYPAQYYIDKIYAKEPFCFVKRTHGVWDKFGSLDSDSNQISGGFLGKNLNYHLCLRLLSNVFRTSISPSRFQKNWGVKNIIHEWMDSFVIGENNYFESVSPIAASFQKTSEEKKNRFEQLVAKFYSKECQLHDALTWKDSVYTGEINGLIKALEGKYVIVVGPEKISPFFYQTGLSGEMVSIPYTQASESRIAIFNKIMEATNGKDNTVILYQAGMLSHIFIKNIYELRPDITQIDLGLVLSIWAPEDRLCQPWYSSYQKELDALYPLKINYDELLASAGPDKLRKNAIAIEKENLPLAIRLMEKALELKPKGQLIRSKVKQYKKKLFNLESKLTFHDKLLLTAGPDKLLEEAKKIEGENLLLALTLMNKALELRPNGLKIQNKINKYIQKINKKEEENC